MNNVKWIIEDFSSDTGFDELAKEVINQGMDCELVNTNEYPIKLDIDRFSTKDDCVLIQSSFQFAEGILHHKSFKPGIFLTLIIINVQNIINILEIIYSMMNM